MNHPRPYPTIGFLIMGTILLAACICGIFCGRLGFPLRGVFMLLGLLGKSYRWPHPPLVLGFSLGPVVEKNLLRALSLCGLCGSVT